MVVLGKSSHFRSKPGLFPRNCPAELIGLMISMPQRQVGSLINRLSPGLVRLDLLDDRGGPVVLNQRVHDGPQIGVQVFGGTEGLADAMLHSFKDPLAVANIDRVRAAAPQMSSERH